MYTTPDYDQWPFTTMCTNHPLVDDIGPSMGASNSATPSLISSDQMASQPNDLVHATPSGCAQGSSYNPYLVQVGSCFDHSGTPGGVYAPTKPGDFQVGRVFKMMWHMPPRMRLQRFEARPDKLDQLTQTDSLENDAQPQSGGSPFTKTKRHSTRFATPDKDIMKTRFIIVSMEHGSKTLAIPIRTYERRQTVKHTSEAAVPRRKDSTAESNSMRTPLLMPDMSNRLPDKGEHQRHNRNHTLQCRRPRRDCHPTSQHGALHPDNWIRKVSRYESSSPQPTSSRGSKWYHALNGLIYIYVQLATFILAACVVWCEESSQAMRRVRSWPRTSIPRNSWTRDCWPIQAMQA